MVVAVATPSSPEAEPSAGRPHPTYKEMILQALTELGDPSGSSGGAIASYIADHFSGLHSRHDDLLSVHLRSLESHGELRLVSGHYFVSSSSAPPNPKRGRGRPRKNADLPASAPIPAVQGPKRGRGHPRKNKALGPVASSPSGVKRGRGRPRKNAPAPPPSSSSPQLGGAVDPPPPPPSGVKKGRGRPRKALVPVRSSFSQLLASTAPATPPSSSGVKRGRGRPRKDSHPPAVAPSLGVEQGPAGGGGGGQTQRNTVPVSLPTPPDAMPHSGKSKPGPRPRVAVDISALRGSPMKLSACSSSEVGEKLGGGRSPKETMQPESVQSVNASLTKTSLGRPTEEKALESGHLKAAQVTEGQHEALTAQAADQAVAVQNEVVAMDLQSLGTFLTEKRGHGRPRKRPLQTKTAEAGVADSAVKRGRGRPRKEKPLKSGDFKAGQMTEGQHEALPAQAGLVQNEVEARDLQSLGTSLTEKKMAESQHEVLIAQTADQAAVVQIEVEAMDLESLDNSLTEKRGRGRPRKRPLETETAEAGVAASAVKRGRGRPRKEKPLETGDLKAAQMTEVRHEVLPEAADQAGPLEAETAETKVDALVMKRGRGRPRKENPSAGSRDTASMGVNRGRGRPRKARPFETASVETAVEVSRDLTEDKPEKDGDLVSGKEAETQGVLLVEGIGGSPADAECLVVSREQVAIAQMDAGGVLLSGEDATIGPMDAGRAKPRVDPMDASTKSH